jgi:alkanesulfonate monooxygenase SsuD/methylene tetrahydromethanopterin reductase-like flavin-dependent oxidoreductase (luciferase family)
MTRHPWIAAGDDGIRWGVQLIIPEAPGAARELVETAKWVEGLGYDALFIFDHPACHIDPWIALPGISTATSTIRLGSAVNCALYRHPAYLARLAADLDNLSDGRLILGLGSGWLEREFAALDLPFPPIGQRQAALREAIRIIEGVWGPEPFSFAGEHFRTEAMQVTPPPVQSPRPPIMIGGSGEKVTLRQVARLADACNIREDAQSGPGLDIAARAATVARKLAALDRHCEEVGRPRDEILATHFTLYLILGETEAAAARKLDALDTSTSTSPGTRRDGKKGIVAGTPATFVEYYRAMVATGIRYFIVQLDGTDRETIELLAREVMPHVA